MGNYVEFSLVLSIELAEPLMNSQLETYQQWLSKKVGLWLGLSTVIQCGSTQCIYIVHV